MSLEAALALHQRGQLSQAEGLYRQILQLEPEHAEALHLLGIVALQSGQALRAEGLIRHSLERNPAQPVAHLNLAAALRELQRPVEALGQLQQALSLAPGYAEAHNNLGDLLLQLERPAEALQSLEQAVRLQPEFALAWNNRGNALRALGRPHEALQSYESALRLQPGWSIALSNRGNALRDLDRSDQALLCYEQALSLDPRNPTTRFNRANLLLELRHYELATSEYEQLLGDRPGDAEVLANLGIAQLHLRRHEAALGSLERALQIRPELASLWSNRGSALLQLGRSAAGLANIERALQLRPQDADALNNQGNALRALRRHEEALRSFQRLLSVAPDYDFALNNVLMAQLECVNWHGLESQRAALLQLIEADAKAADPLTLLALEDDPGRQLKCAQRLVRAKYPLAAVALEQSGHATGSSRLRVAYVSGDFRQHPVSHLLVGVLEGHDRRRLEVIGVSLRAAEPGVFERRVQRAFDRWIELQDRGDRAAAQLLRELQVDVAVDLMGFTQDMRLGIFSHRAAPVQVGYLGYAGTLGAPYMDYLIADEVVIPRGQEGWYAEQVVRLPHCYLPYDDRRELGVVPTRAAAGLPDRGLVFCAFTNSYKLNPQMFDVWMRLLRAVPDSVLWLRSGGEVMMENLRREAQARAVGSERLVFAEHVPSMAQHLARQGLADVFLDTLPYNAHSTACDALWAGVPVLTCAGSGFASRVAASAVRAAGVPELITQSLEQYEQLGLRLAREPQYLQGLKARLRANRGSAALFDTGGYCRALEAAYAGMVERSRGGQSALGFDVPPQALARGALA